jgi:hypothetical protein
VIKGLLSHGWSFVAILLDVVNRELKLSAEAANRTNQIEAWCGWQAGLHERVACCTSEGRVVFA